MDRIEVPQQVISSQGRVRTTVRIDAYLKQLVEDQMVRTKTPSLCFLVENLLRAWVTGETVDIPRARPVVVNMRVNYEVERPRRYPRPAPLQVYHWPPNCVHADQFSKSSKEVGCLERRDWVALKACWDCFYSKEVV